MNALDQKNINIEEISVLQLQVALSELLDATGWALMSREVLFETRREYFKKYARVVYKSAKDGHHKSVLLYNFKLLGLM